MMLNGFGKMQSQAVRSSPYSNNANDALLALLGQAQGVAGSPYLNGTNDAILALLGSLGVNLLGSDGLTGKGVGKGKGKAVRGDPACIIAVRNIPYGSRWQDLKDHMKAAGSVEFCEIDAQGDACVRYASQVEAQSALQLLNGTNFNGRPLKLEVCARLGSVQVHGDPACMVCVGNLTPGTKWQDLKDHMKTAGTVTFCEVNGDVACVRYSSQAQAQNALQQLGGSNFNGHLITVEVWAGQSASGSGIGMDKKQVHGDPACMVCVGNLEPSTKWQEVKDHMKTAGAVEFCEVSDAVACVRYSSQVQAQNALQQLNGSHLNGHYITVEVWAGQSGNFSMLGIQTDSQEVHGEPACMVRVGNLESGSKWQDLKDHMRTAGTVEFCSILAGAAASGSLKRSACVRYASQAEAQISVQMLNGSRFQGRAITVFPWARS